jgi:hypothetical protein
MKIPTLGASPPCTRSRCSRSKRELMRPGSRCKPHRPSKEQILLFVHGYNVSFDNAVRRAGQIAYDLNFDGPWRRQAVERDRSDGRRRSQAPGRAGDAGLACAAVAVGVEGPREAGGGAQGDGAQDQREHGRQAAHDRNGDCTISPNECINLESKRPDESRRVSDPIPRSGRPGGY